MLAMQKPEQCPSGQPVEKQAVRPRDGPPKFAGPEKGQEFRESGRSVFGWPTVERARNFFFNALITIEKKVNSHA
jgi:hypothetical protein